MQKSQQEFDAFVASGWTREPKVNLEDCLRIALDSRKE